MSRWQGQEEGTGERGREEQQRGAVSRGSGEGQEGEAVGRGRWMG